MQQKKQDCKVQQFYSFRQLAKQISTGQIRPVFLKEAPFNQIKEKHLKPLKLHGLMHHINSILTLSWLSQREFTGF